jgi:hypothetical protein
MSKRCPQCKGEVRSNAHKCKYCGTEFGFEDKEAGIGRDERGHLYEIQSSDETTSFTERNKRARKYKKEKSQNDMKNLIILVIVGIVGFIIGYIVMGFGNTNTDNNGVQITGGLCAGLGAAIFVARILSQHFNDNCEDADDDRRGL